MFSLVCIRDSSRGRLFGLVRIRDSSRGRWMLGDLPFIVVNLFFVHSRSFTVNSRSIHSLTVLSPSNRERTVKRLRHRGIGLDN